MTITPASIPAAAPVRPDRPLPDVPRVSHRFVDIGGVRLHVAKAGPSGPPRAPATPCSCCAAFRSIGMPGGTSSACWPRSTG